MTTFNSNPLGGTALSKGETQRDCLVSRHKGIKVALEGEMGWHTPIFLYSENRTSEEILKKATS